MKIKRIEHVGVVVRDLEKSRRLWEDCFGIPLGGVEHLGQRGHFEHDAVVDRFGQLLLELAEIGHLAVEHRARRS